jgi:hypothetical protein
MLVVDPTPEIWSVLNIHQTTRSDLLYSSAKDMFKSKIFFKYTRIFIMSQSEVNELRQDYVRSNDGMVNK